MSDYDNLKREDLIHYSGAFKAQVRPKVEPKDDEIVSKIVGKPIKVNNPELIKLIVKWKNEKGNNDTPDNWFDDPAKIEELKQTFR